MHVKWIKSLARYYENGQINLSNFNLAPQAVKTSTSNLEKQIEASKNGHLSLLNAVSIALDIERSMIENKFFAIFEMEDAKCARIRAGLEKETSKHRRQLEALYSKLSQN